MQYVIDKSVCGGLATLETALSRRMSVAVPKKSACLICPCMLLCASKVCDCDQNCSNQMLTTLETALSWRALMAVPKSASLSTSLASRRFSSFKSLCRMPCTHASNLNAKGPTRIYSLPQSLSDTAHPFEYVPLWQYACEIAASLPARAGAATPAAVAA